MDLEDAAALVTGASSGIGEATALALADDGGRVALAARRRDRLDALADRIEDGGGEALVVETDLTDDAQTTAMVETVEAELGRLDVLVNNAGIGVDDGAVGTDLADWHRTLEVNLRAVMTATHAAVPGMVERGGGHVVVVSSVNALWASPELLSYSASKFGVHGFARALRRDLTDDGVRVTEIMPALTETELPTEEMLEGLRVLDAADVADAIRYAVTRPDHVCLDELVIRPTGQ